MGRLSLVWDAPWLIWTTGQAHEVSRREISNPDMVVEVLRALRHQVGIGAEVIHAEWAKPATVVPSAVLPNDVTAAHLAPLHHIHHGPLGSNARLHSHLLDAFEDRPWLAVEGDSVWAEAVHSMFPQAQHRPLVHALIHDAVQWHREAPCDGWSFRVDIRESGAVMASTAGESLQWVHHLSGGSTAEDALYAMVNAAHRGGMEPQQCRVRWSGEEALTQGWSRFMEVSPAEVGSEERASSTWSSLFQTMESCG